MLMAQRLPDPADLLGDLESAGARVVLVATGGGSAAVSHLLSTPGASAVVLEGLVPYAREAVDRLLGGPQETYCSSRAARRLAIMAWQRALDLGAAADTAVGAAVTASLRTRVPKQGAHRIVAATHTLAATSVATLVLQKDARSRQEEELVAAGLLLARLAAIHGGGPAADSGNLDLRDGEQVEIDTCRAPDAWRELCSGGRAAVLAVADPSRSPPSPDALPPAGGLVFPGSFDPLHEGHLRMALIAQEIAERPLDFELSVTNVDKPALDYLEMRSRAAQFAGRALWFTRAPTFLEKLDVFPGSTFVMGADTFARLADPRYYGGSIAVAAEAVARIAARARGLIVFGRERQGVFEDPARLDVPATLRDVTYFVSQREFRLDISSTALRRIGAVCIAAVAAFGVAASGRADELADALAPHVGQTLDVVELGSGRRLVRPLLEGITERDGRTTALRLRKEGEPRTTSIPMSGVATIIAGRETLHQADPAAAGGRSKSSRSREARETQLAAAHARMQAHGVAPWPALSAEEHAAQVEELEAFVERIKEAFPAVVATQTHEFVVASDIPPAQLAPFTAKLDAMHDFLCDLYGIPRGEPVWKGKCLVVAFLREGDFAAFESRFMHVESRGAHGLCHQRSDGRVLMACHRGTDASAFAHMLVHETSHGFNHRWLSPQPLPNWLNEGIAEWVGTQVVPNCRQVPLKEAHAAEFMKAGGTVGPGFFTDGPDHHIEAVQYGIASSLIRMMVARDRKKFAAFVQGIKEGLTVEESLKASYGGTLADLLTAYGRAAGVPGLKE